MKRYSLLLLLFIAFGCSNHTSEVDLLITNATIVDVQKDTLWNNKTIAISGDRIVAVNETINRNRYPSAEIVNAKGQYVMPGLWDMHVHFFGGSGSMVTENKNLLPLFLAFGVTTVRDAGGKISSEVMKWQQQISNGELAGPAIYTSGPKLDGTLISSPAFIQVEDQQDIEQALDSLETIGVDYIKIYDFSLTEEAYYGIIKEAEQRGLKTTGHVPLSAELLKAAKYGLDGVEHLQHILKPASPPAESLGSYGPGLHKFFPLVESFDHVLASEAYRSLADHNLFVTSTLFYLKNLTQKQEIDHSADTLLSYIGPGIRKSYQTNVKMTESNGQQYSAELLRMTNRLLTMVKPMYDAGINLLAGTDCGPTSPYLYPGHSLHEELKLLVEAGLTPAEALRTSVINGPKFFGLLDSYGGIEKGKIADLLILSRNPLTNIEHISSIESVVARGKFYSDKKLNRLIGSVKKLKAPSDR